MIIPKIIPKVRAVDDIVAKLSSRNPCFVLDSSIIIPGALAVTPNTSQSAGLPEEYLSVHFGFIDELLSNYQCFFVPSQKDELFSARKKGKIKDRHKFSRGRTSCYKQSVHNYQQLSKSRFKEHQVKLSHPGAFVDEGTIDMDSVPYLRARNTVEKKSLPGLSSVDTDLSVLTTYFNLAHDTPTYLLTFDWDLARTTNKAWQHLLRENQATHLGPKVFGKPAPNLYHCVREL